MPPIRLTQDKPLPSQQKTAASAPDADGYCREATHDDKTDKLNSDEYSQEGFEISKDNQKALNEEFLDTSDNDTALTIKGPNNPQNKQRQTHVPTTSNAHIEDIAPDEAKGMPSHNEQSP